MPSTSRALILTDPARMSDTSMLATLALKRQSCTAMPMCQVKALPDVERQTVRVGHALLALVPRA